MGKKKNTQNTSNRSRSPAYPSLQRTSQFRVNTATIVCLGAAIGLLVVDAWSSYNGLIEMQRFTEFWCVTFTVMIVTIQFSVGTLQSLGIDVFGGVSGGNDIWEGLFKLSIGGMYLFDIYTNAWNFGAFSSVTWMPWTWPSMIFPIFLALMVTFGDEMFLRLTERLRLGSRANAIAARHTRNEFKAYTTYLEEMEKNLVQDAKVRGQHARLKWDWMDR